MKHQSITNNLDWISVIIFITLVVMGWLNIYSSSLSSVTGDSSIFDLSQFYGKQLLYIGLAFPLILIILFVEGKFYEKYAFCSDTFYECFFSFIVWKCTTDT